MAENVAPLKAADYAKFPKTDTATYLGMREAFANGIAIVKGKTIKDGEYAAAVKEALHKAIDDNDDLKSAGTQELVKRYFDDVIDRQPDEAHIKAFLKDISIPAETVAKARDGKLTADELGKIGIPALKSANKNLGIKTLTEDFQKTIASNEKVTRDVTITPGAFTAEQAARLDRMDKTFRAADAADAAAFKIFGDKFGNAPAVSPLLATIDPKVEASLSPIVEAATRLATGTSKDIPGDLKTIARKGEDIKDIPADEAKDRGRKALNTIVKIRAGEAKADDFMAVIADKAKVGALTPQPGQDKDNPMADLMKMFGGLADGNIGEFLAAAITALSGMPNLPSAQDMLVQAPKTQDNTRDDKGRTV